VREERVRRCTYRVRVFMYASYAQDVLIKNLVASSERVQFQSNKKLVLRAGSVIQDSDTVHKKRLGAKHET